MSQTQNGMIRQIEEAQNKTPKHTVLWCSTAHQIMNQINVLKNVCLKKMLFKRHHARCVKHTQYTIDEEEKLWQRGKGKAAAHSLVM